MIKQHFHLFCPGPINVAENVKAAAIAHQIGHREEEFSVLVRKLNKKLLEVFEIQDKSKYRAVVVTGSGSAANETVLSSIAGYKKILVLANGEFGNRLVEISELHNPNTISIKFKWAEKMDLKKIEKVIREQKPEIIAMVHHETSIGMLNPIQKVGTLAKKYNMTFFVDAVSSAGAERIDMENWNIDFVSTSSSKALNCLAGLSVIVGKKKSFEATKNNPVRIAYLNLYKFYKYATEKDQTPNTPGVPLFFALEQAVTNIIDAGGASKRHEHTRALARQLRHGMKQMGLKFLISERDMSSVLTTVVMPKSMTVKDLKKKLREKNIIVYDGKNEFEGKVFQVANIGEMHKADIEFFLTELRNALGKPHVIAKPKKKATQKTMSFAPQKRQFPLFPTTTLNLNVAKVRQVSSSKKLSA